MEQIIRARRLLCESGWRDDQQIHILAGRITAIQPIAIGDRRRDAEWLCPAYIDTHVHGGAGVDVMDDDPAALTTLAQHKAREGVGAWLATTVTAPLPEIIAALQRIAAYPHDASGAQLLGSYLEGPWFTPENRGAHLPEWFRELALAEIDQLIEAAQGTLRMVALAPEKPDALTAIRHLKARGIRVMLGHSAASYALTQRALDAGADGLVHCFNGMSGLHHREPGMVGAGLSDTRAWLEVIADGHHVHPAVLRITCQCAAQRIILITDAMRAAGMPDGLYAICGHNVEMRAGVVRSAAGGLAGSTLALDAAVRNMVNHGGVSSQQAIEMASLHPARLLGIAHQLGTLAPGKQANILALDNQLIPQQLWVKGLAQQ
ncbi:N-acetylglucosamine-6-phosphate deacetylase [Pantoea sp. At-9b]|uniref:N-acetylglucosamine-6-phosphate deacetylase n=1 Tax=Pantoea sp. (strain At-9b) TaxID=592316 RepID=UPI0001B3F495|nr:N-acetylglucosamine-6-phosphate deacetylase [Pantoea sp. At-9b]ADU69204.1 N-acetylglucosamine-6-phosphate deacetylase [Pantoea sp. At-9b]